MAEVNEEEILDLCSTMEKLLKDISTSNIIRKANDLGRELIMFLTEKPEAINSYQDISQFIDTLLTQWVSNQNPKVSQNGMDALTLIAQAMQSRYKNYAGNILPVILTKLGDSKELSRDRARLYLLKTVEVNAHSASQLIEKLTPLLVAKNKDMSIEAQRAILEILIMSKEKKITFSVLNELVKAEVTCLNNHLREDAALILIDLAKRIGKSRVLEHLNNELPNTYGHHQKKIQNLIDDVRALNIEPAGAVVVDDEDELDFVNPNPKKVPTGAKPKVRPGPSGMAARGALSRGGSMRGSKIGEGDKYSYYSGPAGEADEAWFINAFKDAPMVTCVNHREFESLTRRISDNLQCNAEFWERKVEALKKIRSIIMHLKDTYEDEITVFIKNICLLLLNNLKDLRSQVVRETCLTFAFVCTELKNKVDAHTCEILMQQFMNNMISSTKVIASASNITMKFILLNVQHSRMINVLLSKITKSKSREVRTVACELLLLVVSEWPVSKLEQQLNAVQDGIRCGMSDSSVEGRLAARRAYWAFKDKFPVEGEALLNSMDASFKKAILSEMSEATDNSQKSTSGMSRHVSAPASARTQTNTSTMPRAGSAATDSSSRRFTPAPSLRSNSAIDLQAVQRAKARQQYAAIARQKVGSGTSLPRAKKVDTSNSSGPLSSNFGMERTSRTRSRAAGVSHSQPSSRSGSPSSRLGYHTYNMPETNTLAYQTRRNVPRSQGTSRETSPNRFGSKSSLTNLLGPKRRVGMMGDRPPIQPSRPVMAQKMLAQSLEAENVPLSSSDLYDPDCLDSPGHKASPRKTSFRSFEDPSDDSDASSLCSEKSFDSYRRTSDSYSWSGSQQRLYRDVWESSVKDITEIIANCESTHWSDRKEGLVALQAYLQASNTLTVTEIKRLTEIFTRMFMDSHTKVFSLFLDTLNELILSHKAVLIDWLYILLTRLLNKLGADLLGSIQNKILKSLDVVRESFPAERQLASVLRFLTDPTQTPNLRVKTAALNYVTRLAAITDPGLAFPPPTPGQSRDLVQAALHKMIGWTMGDSIKQGMELRRAAQEAILALFNLNTPQVTLRLANLPQEYQEAANTLLRGRVRRGSSSSLGGTIAGSPPSPSPRLTPSRHMTRSQDSDLPDIPNPEDVYRSLRKTTAEIQNYTYETGTEKPPEKANTTSKDSGISQLSGTEALEEAMEELSIESSSTSAATTILESLANRVLTVRDCNGMVSGENCQQDDGAVDEQEAMRKIVDALKSPPDSDNGENISIISESEKKVCLGQLTRLIRESSITVLQENFKVLLRILLRNLAADNGNKDVQVRVLVLTALTELIKKPAMRDSFNHYVELLILKVLNSYKDASKEVTKSAESCANTIAMTLAPSMVIRVLAPLIQTGEYPLNLAALKMLTKLVDSCGRDPVYEYLPDLMPGLIQAYDNPESSVRKSAVLCMVSLHMAIGEEELKPHLAALNGSKLKLLHVYILRSQQSSSTPTSPRNHPPAPPSS